MGSNKSQPSISLWLIFKQEVQSSQPTETPRGLHRWEGESANGDIERGRSAWIKDNDPRRNWPLSPSPPSPASSRPCGQKMPFETGITSSTTWRGNWNTWIPLSLLGTSENVVSYCTARLPFSLIICHLRHDCLAVKVLLLLSSSSSSAQGVNLRS